MESTWPKSPLWVTSEEVPVAVPPLPWMMTAPSPPLPKASAPPLLEPDCVNVAVLPLAVPSANGPPLGPGRVYRPCAIWPSLSEPVCTSVAVLVAPSCCTMASLPDTGAPLAPCWTVAVLLPVWSTSAELSFPV